MAALTGSAMRRKRFSDITNITSNGRSERSEVNEQENPNGGPIKSAKDYIEMLLKENNALLRLLDERNKIVEITGTELQKLKISLQKANQQNWQLAQANSHMLAELNLGKDRLKAMQHELGTTVAVLRARTSELQEEKKLSEQYKKLGEKIGTEENLLKPNEIVIDPPPPAYCKKPADIDRKRTLRSRSLGPTCITRQETTKEKDEGRRKSLRRACNMKTELSEQSESLFEIEDIKFALRSQEDRCFDSTQDSTEKDRSVSPGNQNQGSRRRSLIGRPMRRAAEKVNSYKEVPLKMKLRRVE
ncbi:uncharacterized protein A4U43_C04F3250 [Asparagus officinalis]|uniref:Shugoshin C-terminal domain-containing protein n=1 Tax=Asparagus officinalis TaxID=4686 RepID=A0A5P1F0L2_ASPOF|nr:SHUGOSHIN 2-like isoform X2 [Asparagus officinalis]ONK70957.1 uncharacterized protein A4U43_C04F3250 [Asparagus officinalis]